MLDNLNGLVYQDEEVFNDIDPDNNVLNNLYANFDSIVQSAYYSINNYNSSFRNYSHFLSIIHQNIRSINNKFDDMSTFIQSLNKHPDVLVISETWLSDISKDQCKFAGYSSYHTARNYRSGGGISIFVNTSLDSSFISELSICNATIESCVVKVCHGNESMFIVGIYRPHTDSIENFTSMLVDILNNVILCNHNVIIVGDLNINLLLENCHHVEHFINELQCLTFVPLITKPTRFPNYNIDVIHASLLDQIWSNFFNSNHSGIILSDMSDHHAIFIHIPIINSLPDTIKVKFRSHSNVNVEKFRTKLLEYKWDLITGDVDERFKLFDSIVNDIYCKTFPLQTKHLSCKRLKNAWLNSNILKSIKCKSNLLKNLKLGLVSHVVYKKYCNHLKSKIRNAKIQYYHNAFFNSRNNIKKLGITLIS